MIYTSIESYTTLQGRILAYILRSAPSTLSIGEQHILNWLWRVHMAGEPNYPLNYTLDTLSLTVAREFRHGLQVRLDNYPAHGQTAQIAQIVHELDYHMENLQRVEE